MADAVINLEEFRVMLYLRSLQVEIEEKWFVRNLK